MFISNFYFQFMHIKRSMKDIKFSGSSLIPLKHPSQRQVHWHSWWVIKLPLKMPPNLDKIHMWERDSQKMTTLTNFLRPNDPSVNF